MGRVGCGYLLDQFLAPRVAALLFSAVAIGIAFLGLATLSGLRASRPHWSVSV
jgi:hypothetical protein